MTFSPEQTDALKADLNRSRVSSRSQAGRTLSYIEAWWAISEANRIFGFDAWSRETVELRQLGEPRIVDGKTRVGYMAKVRIKVYSPRSEGDMDYITREGCGFGSGIDKDVDQAHESALKEAESDAMKRALMTFGNPFGLALYDKRQANVSDAPAEENNGAGEMVPTPHPEGPDFWGCSGPGITAYAAKKQGLDLVHDKLRHAASDLADRAALRSFCEDQQDVIAPMPQSWRVELRAAVDERAIELGILPEKRVA